MYRQQAYSQYAVSLYEIKLDCALLHKVITKRAVCNNNLTGALPYIKLVGMSHKHLEHMLSSIMHYHLL
jgi:hypothetical protein